MENKLEGERQKGLSRILLIKWSGTDEDDSIGREKGKANRIEVNRVKVKDSQVSKRWDRRGTIWLTHLALWSRNRTIDPFIKGTSLFLVLSSSLAPFIPHNDEMLTMQPASHILYPLAWVRQEKSYISKRPSTFSFSVNSFIILAKRGERT